MNSQMIPIAVINPDAPAESLEAKQPAVDNGAEIYAKDGYFSADHMQREWDKVWTQSWLIAGVSSDLQAPGDYFLFRVRDESIIVTKTEEGVKAFYNVCPHRGARLLTEERGNKKVFVCPFHSWSFRNNGELRAITDEETFQDAVICHRPGLTPVACEEHAGLIFVSMANDPPPLLRLSASPRATSRIIRSIKCGSYATCVASGAPTGKLAWKRFTRAITCMRCTPKPGASWVT
jgi:nitrite reductase/ring-hydroxylating ferredoxin subunit